MNRPRVRQLAWWGTASVYMGLIFWLSSRTINLPIPLFPNWDKVVHFIEYGVLATLLYGALKSSFPGWPLFRIACTAALAASLYGLSDEFHQSFVPGRDASGFDFLTDFVGSTVFVMGIASRGTSRLKQHRTPLSS